METEVASCSSTGRLLDLYSCRYVHHTIAKDGSALETFKRFVTAVYSKDPEVLKPQHLKKLYLFFLHLSKLSRNCSNPRGSDFVGITIKKFNYTVKFSDIFDISEFLFDELSKRFEVCIKDKVISLSSLHSEYSGTKEDLLLLLRCCMATLQLLEVEHIHLEKCRVLLTILHRICSPDLSREHLDSDVPFVYAVLEVFVDELLMHRQLIQYFQFGRRSSTNDKLFRYNCGVTDIDVVLEVISAHFLISARSKCLRKVLDTSISRHSMNIPFSEISLPAAMQLLGSSGIVSAPYTFQAYLISIVSGSIGIDMASDGRELDERLKAYYISAFEKAFSIYTRHISCLELCSYHHNTNCFSGSSEKPLPSKRGDSQSFESFIQPLTYNCIFEVANSADTSSSFTFGTKSEFLISCNAYIKENEEILNKFYKDEILSVLESVVSRSLSAEGTEPHTFRNISQQGIDLLASVMNLMSRSLLQAIRCMQGVSLGSQTSTKMNSFCKEYEVVVGIIDCLRQHSYCQPSQKILNEVMGSILHKESKLMVMHLADILLFCYDRGHEYLWRGCLNMMMTLMNFIVFEDGNFEVLHRLLSSCSATKPSQARDTNSPTVRIAKKFQKIQKLQQRRDSLESAEDDTTCSGENYLKLYNVEQSDMDELADFVVCTKGKSYSKWLKSRRKFSLVFQKQTMAARKRRRDNKRNFLLGTQTRKRANPRYSVYK